MHEQYITSTFLITDGTSSYTVFIYGCGEIGWGGALIGWRSDDYYEYHPLSVLPNSTAVGCLYSLTYCAIVYKVASSDILKEESE